MADNTNEDNTKWYIAHKDITYNNVTSCVREAIPLGMGKLALVHSLESEVVDAEKGWVFDTELEAYQQVLSSVLTLKNQFENSVASVQIEINRLKALDK